MTISSTPSRILARPNSKSARASVLGSVRAANGQMRVERAGDVELVGQPEAGGVAIRGAEHAQHEAATRDRLAVELQIVCGKAFGRNLDRTRET
jgi:hypothetical protein